MNVGMMSVAINVALQPQIETSKDGEKEYASVFGLGNFGKELGNKEKLPVRFRGVFFNEMAHTICANVSVGQELILMGKFEIDFTGEEIVVEMKNPIWTPGKLPKKAKKNKKKKGKKQVI